jgi:hypothetical protein
MKKFTSWMNSLKNNRKALLALIGIDIFMAVGSNIADWPWLMSVKWYLMPFAPICSLYPLTLAIWFSLHYFGKKIPVWYTTFIFVGIVSYGFMAYVYYPAYMAWDGVRFRLVGNMIWVTVYALQSLIIKSELKRLPLYQYFLIALYFGFKDFADRFLGSFIDILRSDFPEQLKNVLFITIVAIHVFAFTVAVSIPYFRGRRFVQSTASENLRQCR